MTEESKRYNGYKLTPAQYVAYWRASTTEWMSAYKLHASRNTLDALVRKGLFEKRNQDKLGAMFSPRTTIEYRRIVNTKPSSY